MNLKNENYYTMIPNSIFYAPDLSDRELRVLILVINLSRKQGYCFASNEYLGQACGKDGRTVSRILSSLEKKGYLLRTVQYEKETRRVIARWISPVFPQQNQSPPDAEAAFIPPEW